MSTDYLSDYVGAGRSGLSTRTRISVLASLAQRVIGVQNVIGGQGCACIRIDTLVLRNGAFASQQKSDPVVHKWMKAITGTDKWYLYTLWEYVDTLKGQLTGARVRIGSVTAPEVDEGVQHSLVEVQNTSTWLTAVATWDASGYYGEMHDSVPTCYYGELGVPASVRLTNFEAALLLTLRHYYPEVPLGLERLH